MFAIPTPQTLAAKALVALVGALLLLSAGAYGGYRWEHGEVLKLQLADQKVLTEAVQAAAVVQKHEDAVSLASAIKEAQAQTKIITNTVTVTKEIPRYVHDQIACPGPTVGLARVLRAAAGQTDPSTLQLAPGQSDDACSDVTASEVAGWFTEFAGAAQANSEQLTALQQWVLDDHKAQVQP
jgi:hypothetical protein